MLLLIACHYNDTTPIAPAGWTALASGASGITQYIYGKYALSNGEAWPTITYNASGGVYAGGLSYSGILASNILNILDNSSTGANVNTHDFGGVTSSMTPQVAGALVVYYGQRNKDAGTDGATYTSPAGFTTVMQGQTVGSSSAGYIASEWLQTTATLISTAGATGTLTDTATQQVGSMKLVFKPDAGGGGGGGGGGQAGQGTITIPPPQRKKYVFYDNYYPR